MYFKKLVKLVLVMYYYGHIGLIYTLEDFINTIIIFKLLLNVTVANTKTDIKNATIYM